MTGEISFFELGVADLERARAFYGTLFGWRFEPVGGGLTITGSNVGGGVHGGDEGASPYVFFRVDDIEEAAARIRELGGTIEEIDADGEADSVERFGRFKLCRDDQGSWFGIHEPSAGA